MFGKGNGLNALLKFSFCFVLFVCFLLGRRLLVFLPFRLLIVDLHDTSISTKVT